VFLDPDLALAQARAADDRRAKGRAMGPLHGVPVGIKDIYDTADMPTCYGSPIYAERAPDVDCTVVSKLKEAGAVIMGKTVTTEFAFKAPSTTQNPHRPPVAPPLPLQRSRYRWPSAARLTALSSARLPFVGYMALNPPGG